MNDFLNNNAGTTSMICALIALFGTILSAVIGRISGKKAAEKEVEELRVHLEQRITQLNAGRDINQVCGDQRTAARDYHETH